MKDSVIVFLLLVASVGVQAADKLMSLEQAQVVVNEYNQQRKQCAELKGEHLYTCVRQLKEMTPDYKMARLALRQVGGQRSDDQLGLVAQVAPSVLPGVVSGANPRVASVNY